MTQGLLFLATEYGAPIDFSEFVTGDAIQFQSEFSGIAPVGYSRVGLALDSQVNDLSLDETGNLALIYDAQAIGQHAKQRTMTFLGEWFLDTTCGVPWLEQIMGRQFDPALSESVIKKELVETDGVTTIEAFSLSFNRTLRGLNVTRATLATEYDEETTV